MSRFALSLDASAVEFQQRYVTGAKPLGWMVGLLCPAAKCAVVRGAANCNPLKSQITRVTTSHVRTGSGLA